MTVINMKREPTINVTTTADISIEKEEDVIYLKSVFHEPLSQPRSDYLRNYKIEKYDG